MGDTPQMQNDEVQSGQSIHKLGHGISGNRRHQCCFGGRHARGLRPKAKKCFV